LIDQLHAPIGLPIGGASPWKIAVSVLAEIVAEIG
jgi:xanthine/CO dehydrogenase XdhC/CoxF family maturation factor